MPREAFTSVTPRLPLIVLLAAGQGLDLALPRTAQQLSPKSPLGGGHRPTSGCPLPVGWAQSQKRLGGLEVEGEQEHEQWWRKQESMTLTHGG